MYVVFMEFEFGWFVDATGWMQAEKRQIKLLLMYSHVTIIQKVELQTQYSVYPCHYQQHSQW